MQNHCVVRNCSVKFIFYSISNTQKDKTKIEIPYSFSSLNHSNYQYHIAPIRHCTGKTMNYKQYPPR